MVVSAESLGNASTLPEAVSDWIERGIVSGRFADGVRIRESEIASGLNVSRAPVREALRILVGRGLVRLVPHVGAVSCGLSRTTVREVYSLRALIEASIARAAVPALTAEDLSRMASLLQTILEQSAAGQWDQMYATGWTWREILYSRSGNRTAIDMVRQLRARLSTVPHGLREDPEHVELFTTFYRQATTAALGRNAEAVAALLAAFMCQTGDQLIANFRGRDADPAINHIPA